MPSSNFNDFLMNFNPINTDNFRSENEGFRVAPNVKRFNPNSFIDGAVYVNNGGFYDHYMRNRSSGSPGVDIDVEYETDFLPRHEKPIVRSPVTGVVTHIPINNWGTVIITDRKGYRHKSLHMNLRTLGPLNIEYFPLKPGSTITIGSPIGILGNVKTKKDHVHYNIYKDGTHYDPQTVWIGDDGAVLSTSDDEGVSNERSPKREKINPDDVGPVNLGGTT